MKTYQVLIVDDSALARVLLSQVIASDAGLEVAHGASGASAAFDYLGKKHVDLICLDVEMPKTNGIEALRVIKRRWPEIPVLMCSSLTRRGAETTLDALAEGAADYIAKPTASTPREQFKHDLLSKIRALVTAGEERLALTRLPRPANTRPQPTGSGQVRALAIGASTGGPAALATVFGQLTRPLDVPMFVVQHMPTVFTKLLAERLTAESTQTVKEGEDGEIAAPGVCYLAPGGRHMTLRRRGAEIQVVIHDGPKENACRPAVDVLFRGLADVYGGDVLGAVLTGMGHDASVGAKTLADAGARIVVQQPLSCAVSTMPNSVIAAGAAHEELSLVDIGRRFHQVGAGSTLESAAGL